MGWDNVRLSCTGLDNFVRLRLHHVQTYECAYREFFSI